LLIDDLSIYKVVLTDEQVFNLYKSNPIYALAHNQHHEFIPDENEEEKGGDSYFYYFYNRAEHDRVPSMDPATVAREKVKITIDGVEKWVYKANRFVAEDATNIIPASISITLSDGTKGSLIANPLMSHLDFRELLSSNSSVIQPYFRLWNGASLYTVGINEGNSSVYTTDSEEKEESSGTEKDLLIAPMQSFFVEKKGDGATLTIKPSQVSTVKANGATLRSTASSAEELLKVIAQSSGKGSSVIIKRSDNRDGYDIPKVFTFLQEVPELYIVDEQAVEIRDMDKSINSVPLALRALDGAGIALTFVGLNTLTEEVSLYDAKENRTVSLSETANTYSFTNDIAFNNRLLLLFAPKTPTDLKQLDDNDLLILYRDNTVQLVASPLDRIQTVKIYNVQGQLVMERNNLSMVVYDISIDVKGVYIVDVLTAHSRSIKKIVNY
ncbi:MAG: T9SS type A sorting domain-containing protein, partial [Tannerella sp.]|nr:T9SS type A sorting domain-containing protein [Tannerella sp.]